MPPFKDDQIMVRFLCKSRFHDHYLNSPPDHPARHPYDPGTTGSSGIIHASSISAEVTDVSL